MIMNIYELLIRCDVMNFGGFVLTPHRYIDGPTGLPVYCAYRFSAAQLAAVIGQLNITAIWFDLQDVGVRLYTFIWTMHKVLVKSLEEH